jgi:hypothetical protein
MKKNAFCNCSVYLPFQCNSPEQIHYLMAKDLTGWKIYGTEKWYVDKGELVCESGPDKQYGYFATEKEYKDFELTLEFKQESNGNSGVFFHSQIERHNCKWLAGGSGTTQ